VGSRPAAKNQNKKRRPERPPAGWIAGQDCLPHLQKFAHGVFLEAQDDIPAIFQDGPLDEIRMGRHQFEGLGARRRVFLHSAFAIKLVARVEECSIVPLADQMVQLLDGESLIEVDFFEFRSLCAKPTLRVAAGGSSRFEVELQCGHVAMVAYRRGPLPVTPRPPIL